LEILPVQPVVTPPIVDAAANLRRSVVVCAVLGVAAIVGLSVAGHPLMGVFGFFGLALGAYNNLLLQRAVIRFASSPDMGRHQFRRGVMGRLGLITLLAIGLGVLVRPDGLGVFAGLAVFQIVMLIGAAVPVFRSLRPSA
jgi:ATP synthase I chain